GVRTLVLLLYDSRRAISDLGASSTPRTNLASHARNQLHILWIALPLGLVLMLGSLSTNTPRYFIEHQFGSRELGIFSAIASLLNIAKTIVNALGQAALPRLARLFASQDIRPFLRLVG